MTRRARSAGPPEPCGVSRNFSGTGREIRGVATGRSWPQYPISRGLLAVYPEGMKNNIPSTPSGSASARAAWHLSPVLACLGAIGLMAGCTTEPESHLVSAPPPPPPNRAVMVTTTTTTPMPVAVAAPAGYAGNTAYATAVVPGMTTTIVTQAPPALQQEVVLAQPTPQHVWLAGYWTWRNERYEWMAGHWELPPNSGSVWSAPRWEQQGNAYRFYEGSWS